MAEITRTKAVKAGIVVRFLASVYDLTILFGVTMLLVGLPITISIEAFGLTPPKWLQGLLFLTVTFAYFVGFWVNGGATTGMRPWKLKLAMLEKMASSDLAIAQAGYNTCYDLVASGLPGIIVPAERDIESQEERVLYFEKLGCALMAPPESDAIRDAIKRLHGNVSLLRDMRKACVSSLKTTGNRRISRGITSLVPKIERIDLRKKKGWKREDL